MFQHEVTHFHTKGKRFGVNSHVQLTTKFLTQTPTKFLKAFCICIVNPLALGFLLLLLGLLGAFFLLRFLYVVAQLGFALFVEFTHKALYIDFLRFGQSVLHLVCIGFCAVGERVFHRAVLVVRHKDVLISIVLHGENAVATVILLDRLR